MHVCHIPFYIFFIGCTFWMMSFIDKAWEVQHKIEKRLPHLSEAFKDKVVIVFCGFFSAMIFLWLQAGRTCYSELDMWVTYGGTIALMIGPMLGYVIYIRVNNK